MCRSSFRKFEHVLWLNDFPFAGKLYVIINQNFHILENFILWVGQVSTRLKLDFAFANFVVLENCISLYNANLPYARKLLNVSVKFPPNWKFALFQWFSSCLNTISFYKSNFSCAGKLRTWGLPIFHQMETWLWFNEFPFAGKLYHYIKPTYHKLENCLLCAGQVSTDSEICIDWMIGHLQENNISL